MWARLQRPGRVGANVAKNIHMNILRMIWAKPQRPAAVAILRMFCELQRIVTEHSLKML